MASTHEEIRCSSQTVSKMGNLSAPSMATWSPRARSYRMQVDPTVGTCAARIDPEWSQSSMGLVIGRTRCSGSRRRDDNLPRTTHCRKMWAASPLKVSNSFSKINRNNSTALIQLYPRPSWTAQDSPQASGASPTPMYQQVHLYTR
jgi:hypothetical protein